MQIWGMSLHNLKCIMHFKHLVMEIGEEILRRHLHGRNLQESRIL